MKENAEIRILPHKVVSITVHYYNVESRISKCYVGLLISATFEFLAGNLLCVSVSVMPTLGLHKYFSFICYVASDTIQFVLMLFRYSL